MAAAAVDDVCTLFEGDYHLGVAALLNSLHGGGFRGRFWVGYRGPLPAWMGDGRPFDASGIAVRPVAFPAGGRHLAHRKPGFMREILRDREPDAAGVCYFDPDIVSLAPWSFYRDWASQGVALCEDNGYARLPATHPFRAHWRAVIRSAGRAVHRETDGYLNSGFVGVTRAGLPLLDDWHAAIDAMGRLPGIDLTQIRSGERPDPCCVPDQDGLNAAAMSADVPVSIMGPDAMGFIPGGFVMHHAVGACKPWRCRYVRQLLRTGRRPDLADKAFWHHVRGPAVPGAISAGRHRLARCDLMAAVVLSRFYGL